jgi:fatty acid amide hydrolase 2
MTTGPICRYSDDLLPMLELLRGPDGIDTACVAMQLVEVDLPLARRIKESVSASVHGTSRRTMRLMGKELAEATHGEAAEVAAAGRISKAAAAALASGGGGSPPAGAPHGAGAGEAETAGERRVGRALRAFSGASSSSDEDASPPPVSSGSAGSNDSGNKLLLVDRTRSQSEGSAVEGDLEELTRSLLDAPLLQRESVLRADATTGGGRVGGGVSTPGGEAVAQGVSAAAAGKPEEVAAAVPFAGGEPAGLRRRGRGATRGSSGEPTPAAGPMPRRRSGGTADALNIISGSSSASLASLEALHGSLGAVAAGNASTLPLVSAPSGLAAGAAPGPTTAGALAETGQHLGSPSPVASRLASRPAITKWSDVTVWLIEDIDAVRPVLSTPIQGSIRKAMNVAAQCLVDTYGCKGVRYLKLPELIHAFDLWSAVLTQAEQPSFADLMAEGYGGTLDVGIELFKWCFGQSTSTLPALLLALVEDLPGKLAPARTRRLVQEAVAVRERVKDMLTSTNGVLLCPVHPTTAPLHDIPLTRFFNVAYTQLFNVLLTPCTVVPMGLDGEGLPVGIQVVGAPAFDRLTIAVAQALEHAGVGGWVPPSAVGDCPHCRFDGASDRPGAVSPPIKRAQGDSNNSNDSGASDTSGAIASATVPAERAMEAALANNGVSQHKA